MVSSSYRRLQRRVRPSAAILLVGAPPFGLGTLGRIDCLGGIDYLGGIDDLGAASQFKEQRVP